MAWCTQHGPLGICGDIYVLMHTAWLPYATSVLTYGSAPARAPHAGQYTGKVTMADYIA